ncbi:stomatin-like protein 2, mitochondrial isoform X3 [Anser cygnoides]
MDPYKVSCPGDVPSPSLAHPHPAGSWGLGGGPDAVPVLCSNRHNTGVIPVLFQLRVQSTALCGLLQGKASYGVEDPEYAVTQLAQTTMRSELGKLSLDRVFRERESLNANIVDAINQASDCWGIRCLRYEIKDIHVPPRVKESMQMQVEAERRKRATVLESEGMRESAINVAEGQKQAQILASEAKKAEQINKAAGEANAMLVRAKAKAEAIQLLAAALAQQHGSVAASLSVAEQYVSAFSKLAKDSSTVLLPANTGDITHMVTQALGIYTTLTKTQAAKTQDEIPPTHGDPQPPSTEVLKAEQATSS